VGIGNPGGLTAESIRRRTEGSLRRLGVDTIDLLYAHHDDPGTPLEETMEAFDALVREGTVRWLGVSNYSADRLEDALAVAGEGGWTPFTVLQGRYNVLERPVYEDALLATARVQELAFVPYWTLAKGFLTGKYRAAELSGDDRFSDRASRHNVMEYATERNLAILSVIDEIAQSHGVSIAAVALAWTAAQSTVAAPIASARTRDQLADLLPMLELDLSEAELAELDRVSSLP
jgi:aryl-alcohol dehydrogenase-like predicted oxidoreductase